jgi:hypothetical protein
MGDDCFLMGTGAPSLDAAKEGMLGANCAGMESMGEASGVCVECEDVLCG